MNIEEKNASIGSTQLGYEDHGIMTAYVHLDYGGGGQGFGGYALDQPINTKDGTFIRRQGTAFGMEFIARILKTLDVKSWEKLPGTSCRVRAEHGKVHAIGHYLKDDWFYPANLLDEMLESVEEAE